MESRITFRLKFYANEKRPQGSLAVSVPRVARATFRFLIEFLILEVVYAYFKETV